MYLYIYIYIYICIHNNLEDLKFTVGTAVQVSQNHGFQYRDHRRFAPDSGIERKFPFRPSKDRISENCIAPSYDREEATKSPKCKIKPTPEWAVFAGTKCSAPARRFVPILWHRYEPVATPTAERHISTNVVGWMGDWKSTMFYMFWIMSCVANSFKRITQRQSCWTGSILCLGGEFEIWLQISLERDASLLNLSSWLSWSRQ